MEHDYLISLLVIVGIDLILGGDNAVVIAMASRNLPDKQRQQAIILGTFIAVAMRIGLTSAAVYLLNIPFLQCAGGIFLLYLGYQLLIEKRHAAHQKQHLPMESDTNDCACRSLYVAGQRHSSCGSVTR